MSENNKKGRNWCWRLSCDEDTDPGLIGRDDLPDFISYIVFQLEIGSETNKTHYQGYLECTRQVRITQLKTCIGTPGDYFFARAKFIQANGSGDDNKKYCTKDDTRIDGPWEYGQLKQQGKRNDLARMRDLVRDGATMITLLDEMPGNVIRYHRSISMLRAAYATPRMEFPEIIVYWGPTGTGKSRRAFDHVISEGVSYYVKEQGKWWDYYDGQHTVIWDEFYGSHYTLSALLRLLDRYPCSVENKGGTLQIASTTKRFIFTSNQHPKDWYSKIQDTHHMPWGPDHPLCRRLNFDGYSRIIYVGRLNQFPPEEEVVQVRGRSAQLRPPTPDIEDEPSRNVRPRTEPMEWLDDDLDFSQITPTQVLDDFEEEVIPSKDKDEMYD